MHRGESPHSSPANSPSSQKSPQSATGFFGFCAVLQSFQEKTNSSSLTLQGTPLKLPHPITKVLGEGGMGFGEGREKPLLPPLWGFFRKVLPPFPNFLSYSASSIHFFSGVSISSRMAARASALSASKRVTRTGWVLDARTSPQPWGKFTRAPSSSMVS